MTFKSFFAVSALTLSTLTWNLTTHSTQEISTQAQLDEVIKSPMVVVKFSAPWCGPCKQMAPIFEDVSKTMTNVQFIKVDTDKSPTIASKYGVQSIPTTIFFKNGNDVGRINGKPSQHEFVGKIKSYFSL